MAIALVTGASRGIGKACALHLARAGYDVALLARTVSEGEAREHSSTVHRSDTTPLPGSLDTTADLVRAAGARAETVPADLLDRASVQAAVDLVLERHGRVDVLVNNGRYIGPGHMDLLLDTPVELLDAHLEANVMAPLTLTRAVLPGMIAAGKGLIVNMTSHVAWADPPAAAGNGGWGLGYAISKGALHRAAGVLAHEVAGTGVLVVNVSPGFIATERMAADMGTFGFAASAGAPPDVVGAAVAWLATHDEAAEWNGKTLSAQKFCKEHQLLAGWPA
ncbi:MAG TPA: SDR family oxidoreductase [Mycobacteriales bacterium]|nr:SDR family oxidoreductase [Mycobacteriales bacterium]